MLQALEVKVLHDTDDRSIIHMATYLAAHVILRETLDKGLVGDEASCLALIIRLQEIPSINNLKVEEAHKVISYRQHLHKYLLAVISGTSPAHLLVRNDEVVGKSNIRDGWVLQ